MHHPTDRITQTTAFVTPVVEHWLEREIAQWVHPMKDRSDDPSHHERTLLPWSYISYDTTKRRRAFLEQWKENWPWVDYSDSDVKMYCTVCKDFLPFLNPGLIRELEISWSRGHAILE